tara:strand:- start:10732 stop:11049 length:318 start_codon:yes stop_codon:yes gene_type:complete
MAKTKLELLGDHFRVENVIKNTYLNSDGKQYGATHKNALSDGDIKGKGTGGNAESLNSVNGGGIEDIEKRNELISKNESKYGATIGPNGYGPNKPYFPNYILDNN